MKKASGLIFSLFVGILSVIPGWAFATHALGADISYVYVSPNVYDVYYSLYRDCAGIPAYDSVILVIQSQSCDITFLDTLYHSSSCISPAGKRDSTQLPGVCGSESDSTTCQNSQYLLPGVQVYVYCGQITLPMECSDWVISHSECCRNPDITNIANPSNFSLYTSATINNSNNIVARSPFFTTDPSQLFCAGFYYCYNNGAVDLDGDSLAFSLVSPEAGNGPNGISPVAITAYNGGLDSTDPISTIGNNFTFDPTTGQICFTANQAQKDVIAIQVDVYRKILGVVTKVGSTRRDMEFNILSNGSCGTSQPSPPSAVNPTGGILIDSNTVGVCHNETLSFNVVSTDPNGNALQMGSDVASSIPGATFVVSGSGTSTVTGTFTWTPTLANAGTHFFTVIDSNSICPIPGVSSRTITVVVYDSVTIASSAPASCNDSVQLTAVGGSTFTWTPATGLGCTTCADPKAMPAISTMYHVKTDCGEDSVLVNVGTPFNLSVSGAATICLNGTAQLNATVTGGANGDTYTYSWSPNTPAGIISNSNIANPVVAPTTTTDFIISVLSSEGCALNDSVLVTVSGQAPTVTVSADPTNVCAGGTVQLLMNVAPPACGASSSPCSNTSVDFTIGTATTFDNPSAANGEYPDIFGFSNSGAKHQILYKAADLQAQGLTGGTITKLSFDVEQVSGVTNLCFFDIQMKCTNLNSLVNWDPNGLTQVFGPKSITVTPGWNTFTLDQPYNWDGVSDLLLDLCYNNDSSHQTGGGAVRDCSASDATGSTNTVTYYTGTPYFSVIFVQASFVGDLCSTAYNQPISVASGNPPSTHRPNIIFSVCSQSLPVGSTINWTPAAGVSNPHIQDPTAQVFQNTTYTASVTEGACTGSAFVNVTVNNNLKLTTTPVDTSICNQGTITLTAQASGAPPSPIALTCGPNTVACGGAATEYVVGNTGIGNSNTITPFNGAQTEEHLQMLYQADELSAAGLSRGIIENLAFNVTNKSSTAPYQNFTIKMGCTAQDTLTNNFINGLTQVYSNLNYNSVVGWNDFLLSTAYDWDGISNLIVEVCFTNPPFGGATGADAVIVSPTGYSSTIDTAESLISSQSGCAIASGSLFALRPAIRFNECPPPPGTFQYTWTPISGPGTVLMGSTQSVTPAASVTYLVELTDNFCYVYDTVKINVLNGYSGNMALHDLNCNGNNTGNISVAPTLGTAPYTFVWTDVNNNVLQTTPNATTDTIKNLAPGEYFVNMTDANGCQGRDSIQLTVPQQLAITNIAITNVTCFNGSNGAIMVTVSSGTPPYTYLWPKSFTDTSAISGLVAGTDTLLLTDSSGCVIDTPIQVKQPLAIADTIIPSVVSCFGGSNGKAIITILGGSGNFTVQWNNGITGLVDSGLAAGEYYVTITDAIGNCTKTDSVTITQNNPYVITISNIQPTSCYNTANGTASASVNGDTTNYTFLWDDGETTAYTTSLPRGERHVTLTDTLGCKESDSVLITSPPQFNVTVIGIIPSCYGYSNGKAYTVDSGGFPPYTDHWSTTQNGDTAIDLSAGIIYYDTVTDSHGCPEYASITLSQPDTLVVSGGSVSATCFGGTNGKAFAIVTGGTPGYAYSWSNGGSLDTIVGLALGNYSVTVTDANGCTATTSNIAVGQPATPVSIQSVNVVNVSCRGDNDGGIFVVATGGAPGYTYSLNGGTPQSNGNFNPLAPDSNYVLTITDSTGCTKDTTIAVSQPDSFSVSFVPPVDSIKIGDSIMLSPVITPPGASDIYTWTPSFSLNCDTCNNVLARPVITTVYELTVSRNTSPDNECSVSSRIEVVVLNNKILYIPNAFTPNGDGINDYFQVSAPGGVSLVMKIFDRWGELIFAYDGDMTGKWDGTYKGQKMLPDVYVYYIEVTYLDQQVRIGKGSITLIK